jgi:hypothetical protein
MATTETSMTVCGATLAEGAEFVHVRGVGGRRGFPYVGPGVYRVTRAADGHLYPRLVGGAPSNRSVPTGYIPASWRRSRAAAQRDAAALAAQLGVPLL